VHKADIAKGYINELKSIAKFTKAQERVRSIKAHDRRLKEEEEENARIEKERAAEAQRLVRQEEDRAIKEV